jgi:hypothetical protein
MNSNAPYILAQNQLERMQIVFIITQHNNISHNIIINTTCICRSFFTVHNMIQRSYGRIISLFGSFPMGKMVI